MLSCGAACGSGRSVPGWLPGYLARAQGLCPAGHHGYHRSFPGPKLDWVVLSPHTGTTARAGIMKWGPGQWEQEGRSVTGHALPLGMEAAAWRPEPLAVAHRGT